MQEPQQPKKKLPKNQILISNSVLTTADDKSRAHKTFYTETYHSQPRLQNKRLKYGRAVTNTSFFNHLQSSKIIEVEQLLDDSFVKFLDNVQKHRGFRGTKTQSWNQLMYLTPQKRHKNSTIQLKQIKKQLYQMIKPVPNSINCNQNSHPHPQKQQKSPIKTTLVQFLTGYNLQKNESMPNTQKIHVQRCQRKGSNIIREKLKSYQKVSEYRSKMKNYQMLFQGYKL